MYLEKLELQLLDFKKKKKKLMKRRVQQIITHKNIKKNKGNQIIIRYQFFKENKNVIFKMPT